MKKMKNKLIMMMLMSVLSTSSLSVLAANHHNHHQKNNPKNQSDKKSDAKMNPKLALIKQFYTDYLNDKTDSEYINGYYTSDLNEVFDRDSEMAEKLEGIACLDFDYVVQGQDFDSKEILNSLKLDLTPKGLVQAKFKSFNHNQSVEFELECEKNECRINDMISSGKSLKKQTDECLDELSREQNKTK